MVKLILSDLDGTLVPEGTSVLPEEVRALIARLQRCGIAFAVSSGRQHASLRQVFRGLDRTLIISLNGGCICRGDECLYTNPMERMDALAIAEDIYRLPTCDAILETHEQCWVYAPKGEIMCHELDRRNYRYRVIRDLNALEGEIIKVACYDESGRVGEKLEGFQRRWGERVQVARSGERWVDFNVSDKGQGLLAACRLLGITPAETAAFGDNLNDRPMLLEAGQSWVVSSGSPALRAEFPTCRHPAEIIEKIAAEAKKTLAI